MILITEGPKKILREFQILEHLETLLKVSPSIGDDAEAYLPNPSMDDMERRALEPDAVRVRSEDEVRPPFWVGEDSLQQELVRCEITVLDQHDRASRRQSVLDLPDRGERRLCFAGNEQGFDSFEA